MDHIHIVLDLELYIKTTKFKTLKYIWHRYTMANTHLFRQGQGMRFCILFLFFCSFLLISSTFSKRTFHGFDYKLAPTIIISFLQYSMIVHLGWTMFNFPILKDAIFSLKILTMQFVYQYLKKYTIFCKRRITHCSKIYFT